MRVIPVGKVVGEEKAIEVVGEALAHAYVFIVEFAEAVGYFGGDFHVVKVVEN